MKKTLLLSVLAIAVPVMASTLNPRKNAPEGSQTAMQDDAPVISDECRRNLSVAETDVKIKQFDEAYEPWLQVYKECPNMSKNIYIYGAKIVDHFYEKATDPEEKQRWGNLALELCDSRIKWFGDDPKYPTAYILGEKGLEYCEHFPEDQTREVTYPWFKESIETLKEKSKIAVLVEFMKVSYSIYRTNPEQYAEQFIADYTLVSGYLQQMADDKAHKNSSAALQQKDYVDNIFAISGAAECSKLDELYIGYVNNNSDNLDVLLKVMKLYKRVKCTESDVYFTASEFAHKLQPTEESAAGCARMCMKKEDWKGAIDYYNEAIGLIEEQDDDDLDDYLYMIAFINMDKLKNYMEARTYARRSLEANPLQGRCYILIGYCYAASTPYSEKDYPAQKCAILNKTVFWAAVDKFQRAKEVDPTCADDANKLIATYSRFFPTKEEMFDLPNEFNGDTFIVGGWINEKTHCRAAK